MSTTITDRLTPCRTKLRRGDITLIASLTGRNVHTVRLWVNHGEPIASKLTDSQRDALRQTIEKCIMNRFQTEAA